MAVRQSLLDLDVPVEFISNAHSTFPSEDGEAVMRGRFRDFRVIIPFCILGGDVGYSKMCTVIRNAKMVGCKVVTIAGIPFIEQDRRQRALDSISEVKALTDRLLIIDMAVTPVIFKSERTADQVVRMVDYTVLYTVNALAKAIEGPFFSIFEDEAYTFAYSTDTVALNAVMSALEAMILKADFSKKSVIMLSSHMTSGECEIISEEFVKSTGSMPEIIRREDKDDSKVLVFLPIKDE